MRRGGIFGSLFLFGEWVSEKTEKDVPAENWANKKLYYQDLANGVPAKKRAEYAKQGRYKLPETPKKK